MNNYNIRDLQTKLLELMKIFHGVCEKHSIKYYMLGGTLLGAIRHGGFIPWDDDIDVGLPRKDYEKLISLDKNQWPNFVHIKTAQNSPDLIFPYSKIMNTNTTVVEKRMNGIVGGIYIDIFPLDGLGNSKYLSKIYYYQFYWKLVLLYYNQDHGTKRNIIKRVVQQYARKQDITILYNNVMKKLNRYNYNESKYVGNLVGAYRDKEIVPKKYFGTPTLYKFEDTYFYGPQEAKKYLTAIYGDYMKLPDSEKRKSHHNYLYVNLNLPFREYINNATNIKIRGVMK